MRSGRFGRSEMAAYLPLFNYEITQQGLFFSLENGERGIGRVSCLQSVYEAAVNVTVTRDIAIVRRGRILGVSVDSGVFSFGRAPSSDSRVSRKIPFPRS